MMASRFFASPCGPKNKELERIMEVKVFYASNLWAMKQAKEDLDDVNAPEKFRNALMMTLRMEQFGGKEKKYTHEQWAKLIFAAHDEGPPTENLVRLYNELQRLQVCLGELTFDQALEMNHLNDSKDNFDKFMSKLPPSVQNITRSRPKAQTWKADNGEFMYPSSSSKPTNRTGVAKVWSNLSMFHFKDPTEPDPCVTYMYQPPSTHRDVTSFLDVIAEQPKEEEEKPKEEFPALPTKPKSPPKSPPPKTWTSPSKKVTSPHKAKWNPYITIKYKKGKRGKKKKK